MDLKETIEGLKEKIRGEMEKISSHKIFLETKMKFLGRGGEVQSLFKGLKDVPKEEKPAAGKLINDFGAWAEKIFDEREEKIKKEELEKRLNSEKVDVTMPGKEFGLGSYHPDTLIKRELVDVFSGMGFEIFEGPEIETDYYNFTALNTPKDHPARDMQDTFYLTDTLLLRTQTSAGQIRVMEKHGPPIKILSPGKVYRSDQDATHSPMFSQMEGLVVDEGITMCDLKGMLDEFAKKIFGEKVETRLRPSYFPFTEPSVEVDVSCFSCGGKGCRLCKGTGWIEVLGAGMVNRKVLSGCGIDPDKYTGFAFGMGVERIAMLKYGITNMKNLFDGDVRFLSQFKGQGGTV
ncbi:MAG: phenylalanine--tRNA ligase subunit alpha [Clostridia bacterium]|nr:phenylalanine--tRNA ligase subunit alpha [Clostridia bacterium]